MNVKLTDPSLLLTFEANDLEPGHSTSQTISSDNLVNRSFSGRFQKFSQLKSSSDQISLQIKRKCPSTEDIIATDGNVRAVLKDGEEVIYTGYISTSYKWVVTNHGESALSITIEGVGTRLLNQPFIETGKHYFDCAASAAVYDIVHPLGITIHSGDERKILQSVSKEVEAGDKCRDLLDSLFYECNAVYWFDNLGELRITTINPSTTGAQVINYNDLYVVGNEAVSLSKTLRAYKGARITYTALGSSSGYLVYRNTTNATATRICNLELKAGEYFDGAEIYTAAEWAAATADEFREPTLISAVNAASESAIVGSGKIVNISNLVPVVTADSGITATIEAAGGPYFKIVCHNTTGSTKTITRLDLKADIIYEKSTGVIRTQIDGSQAGKSLLEEELVWIHDKENASAHANLVSQYFQYASATYTFRSKNDISTGTVIRLKEDLYSGLDVYVMITAREFSYGSEVWKYTAVGISTFDLSESAYHGTTEPAKQSGAQGPAGEPGASTEVQYALGDSFVDPPGENMLWGGADMLWGTEDMMWNIGTYSDDVPDEERGKYVWMRVRTGDDPWQYTRLTGATAWDPSFLGLYDSITGEPTQTPDGLNLVVGDCFTALETWSTFTKGITYTYTGSGWIPAGTDRPKILLEALNAMKEAGVDFKNLNDPNTISWFSTIIADTVVANTIKSINGFFENITVTGKSSFEGNIESDALTTYDSSDGRSVTFTTDSNNQILRSVLSAQFDSYGRYYAISGSITTKDLNSGATQITTTATTSDRLVINYTETAFSIIKENDGSVIASSLGSAPSAYTLIVRGTNLTFVSIPSCSLGLSNEPAGALVSVIKPKDNNSSIGTQNNPMPVGWFGSFAATLPTIPNFFSSGHCTLTNGLELKWGHIPSSENDGSTSIISHTFSTAEGGAFSNATLLVLVNQANYCAINTLVYPPSAQGAEKFYYSKTAYAGGGYSSGVAFDFLAIGY